MLLYLLWYRPLHIHAYMEMLTTDCAGVLDAPRCAPPSQSMRHWVQLGP